MRKFICLALACLLTVSPILSSTASAAGSVSPDLTAAPITSADPDQCGTSARWDLSGGTFTVSGTGAMYNYLLDKYVPWFGQNSSISRVVISEGITTVGSSSFGTCRNLSSVSLPSTLISIGAGAFQNCSSLSHIDIPYSVVTIGKAAFQDSGVHDLYISNPNCNLYGDAESYPGITIHAPSGSAAERFAASLKINFVPWNGGPVAPPVTQPTTVRTTTTTRPTTTTTRRTTTTTTSTRRTTTTTTTTTRPTTSTTTTTTAFRPFTTTTEDPYIHKYTLSIEVASMPDKTRYYTGEPLDLTGLTVNINRRQNGRTTQEAQGESVADNRAKYTISGFDSRTAGSKMVTVTYRTYNYEGGEWVEATTSFWVNVTERPVTTAATTTVTEPATTTSTTTTTAPPSEKYAQLFFTLASPPTLTEYYVGEDLRLDGGEVSDYVIYHDANGREKYFDNFTRPITEYKIDASGYNKNVPGTYTIYVIKEFDYDGCTATAEVHFDVTVKDRPYIPPQTTRTTSTTTTTTTSTTTTSTTTTTTTTTTATTTTTERPTTTSTSTTATTSTVTTVTTTKAPDPSEIDIILMQPDESQLKKGNTFPIRFDGGNLEIYYVSSSNNSVASASNDGTVTINGPGAVTLTIGFHDPTWRFMTQKFLSFTVPQEAAPPEENVPLGDVNEDGKVNAGDASEILMEYSRLSAGYAAEFTERQKKSADLDKNGKINAADATMVLQYYSYLSTGGTDSIEKFLSEQ